jgi:polyhydroxybutyrate depolymerase
MRNTPINTRLIAIAGVIIALFIFVSVTVYAYRTHQSIVLGGHSYSVPLVTCTTPPHNSGDSTSTLLSGGLRRSFLLHLPPSYGKQPQPLIVAYHGYSWTSQIMEHNSNMPVEADKAGFMVVFPQGVDSPPSWNAGVGAYGPTGDADDIQFTRDLLSYLETNYCVDAHRIYVVGFSLGGGMAYRVACTLTDKIAAVASISGAYYPIPGGCQPTRPIAILEIHGAADTLAPYAGNSALRMAAVQDYLNGWLERDKCSGTSTVFFQQGDVTGTQWTHCAPNVMVRHYRVSDGQHTWPGSPNTTHVIDANVVIWDFFNQFSL